ncbi:MAG: prepilin-type N-terminal cleavage/methylation domain-containing protein [Deltaproteobacteria bacterium]|jgi:prepilin-type N-terminal cleavage/methylation domain-containing protein|nr:prepilin-type N-terminal cleavage/methylation domain-containing protein [Deltaproteobacteria bacterium]MCL6119930.1 prepilin-type N-terminal cleavage/methylation domain-containing protein [Deltaproteobacteria bacterium]
MNITNKDGFSLIEIVFTIIIIGLAMGAVTESFIVGSAKSINIVNEETALNLAKQEMAALNYCRDGGTPTSGACQAWTTQTSTPPVSPWTTPFKFQEETQPPINNECFNTKVTAKYVYFNDVNGTGTINLTGSTSFIQAIVQTGWFSANGSVTCPSAPARCPGTEGSCPYVTLSTVYADY